MKSLIYLFLISLFVTTAASAKLTRQQKGMAIGYTVKNGDTLYTIAHEHHTSIKELLKANNLERGTLIKVGQTLDVPLNTYFPDKKDIANPAPKTVSPVISPLSPKASSGAYTIQNGDTLFTIARAHHTTISALLKANGLDMQSLIKVGQTLTIPSSNVLPDRASSPKEASVEKKSQTKPPVPTNNPASTPNAAKGKYIVKKGDSLFSIARKNHIIISKLMQLNGIGLGNALHIGQVLKISEDSTYIATKAKQKNKGKEKQKTKLPVGAMPSYTVKKGDTLWKIARKNHLTLAQIRKLNKMRRKDRIHTGMVLAVGKAVQPKSKTYKVKKGDTLWLIAKKNKMNTKKLRKLNHMSRKDRIHTGMVLALTKEAVLPKAKLKKKKIETPLRIAKKKKKKSKKSRFSSASSILNSRGSRGSRWSGGNSKVIRTAKRYLGRRYVWGAEGPRSFDCSGFTQYVMRKSKGVRLPRVSRKQAYYGKYVSRSRLRPGDLIFFDTSRRRRGYVNHVGIYIGNNKFIHASSARHRVVITSLNRPFYRARFKWGRRVN